LRIPPSQHHARKALSILQHDIRTIRNRSPQFILQAGQDSLAGFAAGNYSRGDDFALFGSR